MKVSTENFLNKSIVIFHTKGTAVGHEMDDVAVALGVGVLNHSVESIREGLRFRPWMRTPGRSYRLSRCSLVDIVIVNVERAVVVVVHGENVIDRWS
jgi:hypothetical protein